MSYYGTYSPTLGWYVFGPLSVFLFKPTVFWTTGGRYVISGPSGPYEWWYLSTTPDMSGVFAVPEYVGTLVQPPKDQYVGSALLWKFKSTRDVSTSTPYLIAYSSLSSYLAALLLPLPLNVAGNVSIYVKLFFQNRPLS